MGLEVPSVDALDSKTLPIYHVPGRNDVLILESLALIGVPEQNQKRIPPKWNLFERDTWIKTAQGWRLQHKEPLPGSKPRMTVDGKSITSSK